MTSFQFRIVCVYGLDMDDYFSLLFFCWMFFNFFTVVAFKHRMTWVLFLCTV